MRSWQGSLVTVQTPARDPFADALRRRARLPLVVEAVHRGWGPRPVLVGASLTLAPGTVAWLGGPNGAGKTTLLRTAAGLLAPERGRVTVLGLDSESDRREYQRRIGFLAAGDRGLQARLTVAQNLELFSALALIPGRRRAESIGAALARFDLTDLSSRRVERLSMGQRQRVRLAITFLHEPIVALLDEPHTSLDEVGLGLLEDAIARLMSRGGTALWCSPSMAALPLPADERYRLDGGRVVCA